jgi:predicted ATP-dependent protease
LSNPFMARGFASSAEVKIPTDPFERIIGQDEAVRIARLVPTQRRHLLLVGPPGSGKSLIAKAISSLIPQPKFEISLLDNPNQHERPIVEIRDESKISQETNTGEFGSEVKAEDIPAFVAERLGLRCRRCATLLRKPGTACATCDAPPSLNSKTRVATISEEDEDIIYSITRDGKLIVQTESELKAEEESRKNNKRKILLPLKRKSFIGASGASETELLGDVAHDPYGEKGSAPYKRVKPGAIHEAHEGVLFIDELSTLGNLQRYLLSAMQEKAFQITGRNPTSSGASVRVDGVPCDFIFVGASNMNDLQSLLPALRSRISGDGYEVLMNSVMPDNEENRDKLIQFIAQEINKDGRIPHADPDAIDAIIKHAKKIAKEVDDASNSLTLRLRNLSGIIKLAGDMAAMKKSELISADDVKSAIENSRSIEEKIIERYGSSWRASASDYSVKTNKENKEIR